VIKVLPQVVKLLNGTALDFLFPRFCVGCGKEGGFLCDSCCRSLTRIMPPLCVRCGRPQPDGSLCPGCTNSPAAIDGIRSPFQFDGVMRQAIHQLKYRHLRALATPLAKLLQEYLIINPIPAEFLVPVPLHQKRLRERGYNQSALLAWELSNLINIPVADNCLIRQSHTKPQVGTANAEERRNNVTDAFTCRNRRLQGRQVLLIDDVATSGATLNSCAAALKATGTASVWGLVMAREI